MKDNRTLKIFIIIIFPFFRALLIGNTLFDVLPIMITWGTIDFVLYFNENYVVLAVMNALLPWALFYLAVIIIFKRGERFDRLYEFSKLLKITVPLGLCLLVYSFLEEAGYVWGLGIFGLIYYAVVFCIIVPTLFYEASKLGNLIRESEGYDNCKSQYLSFGLLLVMPFAAVYLMRVLFHHIAS
ncbi:MAG: hypothetical protein KAS88_05630 [Deltaproteobacteria bacterium]|nr:hypothetical protein [Deltaproteobacteria bacterium]